MTATVNTRKEGDRGIMKWIVEESYGSEIIRRIKFDGYLAAFEFVRSGCPWDLYPEAVEVFDVRDVH